MHMRLFIGMKVVLLFAKRRQILFSISSLLLFVGTAEWCIYGTLVCQVSFSRRFMLRVIMLDFLPRHLIFLSLRVS